MTDDNKQPASDGGSRGLGLLSTLFVVFLVLKLTGTIQWSWVWVTAPLWGQLALYALVATLVATGLALREYNEKNKKP